MHQYRRFCSTVHEACQHDSVGGLYRFGIYIRCLAIPDAAGCCRLRLHAAAPLLNILSISASE